MTSLLPNLTLHAVTYIADFISMISNMPYMSASPILFGCNHLFWKSLQDGIILTNHIPHDVIIAQSHSTCRGIQPMTWLQFQPIKTWHDIIIDQSKEEDEDDDDESSSDEEENKGRQYFIFHAILLW